MESPQQRFALNLRLYRKELGQSLQDVADGSGLSKTQVWQLEKGDNDPRLSTVMKLCEHFGVLPQNLLESKLQINEAEMIAWCAFKEAVRIASKRAESA